MKFTIGGRGKATKDICDWDIKQHGCLGVTEVANNFAKGSVDSELGEWHQVPCREQAFGQVIAEHSWGMTQ